MKLSLHEVAKVVGAKNTISEFDDVPLRQIEFDSRKIEKGDLFLPLKGERDGHDFIELAFKKYELWELIIEKDEKKKTFQNKLQVLYKNFPKQMFDFEEVFRELYSELLTDETE